jgi:hypothetical protein
MLTATRPSVDVRYFRPVLGRQSVFEQRTVEGIALGDRPASRSLWNGSERLELHRHRDALPALNATELIFVQLGDFTGVFRTGLDGFVRHSFLSFSHHRHRDGDCYR